MEIAFATDKLRKLATDPKLRRKQLGPRCGDILGRRLDDLRAAADLEAMKLLPGRCHALKEDRKGQFALDLEHPKRLIFRPQNNQSTEGPDWSDVTAIEILEIVDYHR